MRTGCLRAAEKEARNQTPPSPLLFSLLFLLSCLLLLLPAVRLVPPVRAVNLPKVFFSPRRVLCVSAAAAQEKADASRLLLLLLLLLDTPSPFFPETAIAKFPVRARVSVRAFSTSGTSRQVLRPLKTEVNVEKK